MVENQFEENVVSETKRRAKYTLEFKLKVWLDQGFGYWSSPSPGTRAAHTASTWFNFKGRPFFAR